MIRIVFDHQKFRKTSVGKFYRKYNLWKRKKNITSLNFLIRKIELAEREYFEATCKVPPMAFMQTISNTERQELSALRVFKSSVISAKDKYLHDKQSRS